MFSVIKRRSDVEQILASEPNIIELYARPDFSFYESKVDLYILHKHDINTVKLLYQLSEVFDSVNIYPVKDSLSALLAGKRIIWKEGTWYI